MGHQDERVARARRVEDARQMFFESLQEEARKENGRRSRGPLGSDRMTRWPRGRHMYERPGAMTYPDE
jgi:hypothetical protein